MSFSMCKCCDEFASQQVRRVQHSLSTLQHVGNALEGVLRRVVISDHPASEIEGMEAWLRHQLLEIYRFSVELEQLKERLEASLPDKDSQVN